MKLILVLLGNFDSTICGRASCKEILRYQKCRPAGDKQLPTALSTLLNKTKILAFCESSKTNQWATVFIINDST